MTIRDAGAADLSEVLALNREYERFLSPLGAGRLRELHDESACHRVFVDGDRIAGFLLAFREGAQYDSPNYRWFAARYPSFLYIDRIVVGGEFQGRGAGAALYADLIAAARRMGVALVTCEFDLEPPNEASARFHARFGFSEVGRQRLAGGKTVSLQALAMSTGADAAGAGADEARARARRTYNAAADAFDDPANSFWERFGRRTIDRLRLRAGDAVLDVCCGSGASALPAAECVGASGSVLGVDLAERLLENARSKAAARSLGNARFRVGDLLDLQGLDGRFDAVVCVFGIFFVPDMPLALRSLWKCVRPGGQLAITTWGPRFFEPATSAFWASVRSERPELYKGFNPWDRICEPDALVALFAEAGIPDPVVVAEPGRHPIPSPQAWWSAVLGSGYRGTIEQLDPEAVGRVRAANLEFIRGAGIESVEANVLYAIASKP